MARQVSLEFIQQDVTQQLRMSRELLKIAKHLNTLAQETTEAKAKVGMSMYVSELMKISQELSKNASDVGRAASGFIPPG
jgi:hypothetical protein